MREELNLLPCPFCGNKPLVDSCDEGGSSIRCRTFMCPLDDVEISDDTIEDVSKRWNKRVTPHPASVAQGAAKPWRTDMQNAPKDRPFLVYWHMSDIYGVLEWIDNKWIDQDGDEVMAFRCWSLFDLPESAPQVRASQHAEQQPNGDAARCGADIQKNAEPSAAVPSTKSGGAA